MRSPTIIISSLLPKDILSKIDKYLYNDIALEAAFYKVWLGDTDPYEIKCEDMVFPSYWGQSYLRGNKQIEIFGTLQSDKIYTFQEIFLEAKNTYKYI